MKFSMEGFCARFPTLYLLVVGIGGVALIIGVPTFLLYTLGAPKAADSLASALTWIGVVWMLLVWFKVRPYFDRR